MVAPGAAPHDPEGDTAMTRRGLRWGLIGASDIAATRMIPAIHESGGAIGAVASGDPAHGAAYAQRNGIDRKSVV